jgi:hypothetical protein
VAAFDGRVTLHDLDGPSLLGLADGQDPVLLKRAERKFTLSQRQYQEVSSCLKTPRFYYPQVHNKHV